MVRGPAHVAEPGPGPAAAPGPGFRPPAGIVRGAPALTLPAPRRRTFGHTLDSSAWNRRKFLHDGPMCRIPLDHRRARSAVAVVAAGTAVRRETGTAMRRRRGQDDGGGHSERAGRAGGGTRVDGASGPGRPGRYGGTRLVRASGLRPPGPAVRRHRPYRRRRAPGDASAGRVGPPARGVLRLPGRGLPHPRTDRRPPRPGPGVAVRWPGRPGRHQRPAGPLVAGPGVLRALCGRPPLGQGRRHRPGRRTCPGGGRVPGGRGPGRRAPAARPDRPAVLPCRVGPGPPSPRGCPRPVPPGPVASAGPGRSRSGSCRSTCTPSPCARS